MKMEHRMKQIVRTLGIPQQKHCKSRLKVCKHKEIKYCLKILRNSLSINDSMNDLDLIDAPKIQKLEFGVGKLKGSDIEWSNPYGD